MIHRIYSTAMGRSFFLLATWHKKDTSDKLIIKLKLTSYLLKHYLSWEQ